MIEQQSNSSDGEKRHPNETTDAESAQSINAADEAADAIPLDESSDTPPDAPKPGPGHAPVETSDKDEDGGTDDVEDSGIFDLADEDDADVHRAGIKALDICPNCSEPIEDITQIVCMKCGFNLRTLEVMHTKADVEEIDEQTIHGRPPISAPGRGDLALPLVAASVSVVIVFAALFAGHFGLFAGTVNEARHAGTGALPADYAVPWLTRLRGLLQYMVVIATWFGIGIGTLWLYARVMEHPMGELRLASARIFAIVTTMKLASLIPLTTPGLRGPLEILGHLIILYLMSLALFRMTVRTAGFFVIMAAVMTMIAYLASTLIVWSVN